MPFLRFLREYADLLLPMLVSVLFLAVSFYGLSLTGWGAVTLAFFGFAVGGMSVYVFVASAIGYNTLRYRHSTH